ncbi:MAG: DUF1588 domain-containing protein [Akkermansiaceae bacterium]|jgi:cytochrome c553
MSKALLTAVTFITVLHACMFESALAVEKAEKAEPSHTFKLNENSEAILDRYCSSCHDEETHKGDIRLDNLAELDNAKRLDILNQMQEQIYFQNMPPKEKRQPSEEEKKAILAVLSTELGVYKASTLEDKLQKPEYGNYVDHNKLFSGEYKNLPGFTYDRRWLISEYIFNAKFHRMIDGLTMMNRKDKRFNVLGSSKIQNLGLANPFLLPTNSGIRYYANEDLTGGHLSSMLTNAEDTSEYMTDVLAKKNAKFVPAISQIMALDDKQQATLISRVTHLENSISQICEEIHAEKHESMLPAFKPVELKPIEKPAEGETYKKAPIHVAQNMLKDLEGDKLVYTSLVDPKYQKMSDDEFRNFCERQWYHAGDYERNIQGRMAILREYMPELREIASKDAKKFTPLKTKPLSSEEIEIIKTTVLKHRKKGDYYKDIIEKCVQDWKAEFEKERVAAGPPSEQQLRELMDQLCARILERPLKESEATEYVALAKSYTEKLGKLKAIQKIIQTFILTTEFSYRQEFGTGTPDEHDRKMLSPRDASYAIAYALTDHSPDDQLVAAANSGKLNTRDDYKREVLRILNQRDKNYIIDNIIEGYNYGDNTTDLPIRKLRFFREFFGYPSAMAVFKDEKRFGSDRISDATARLVNEADRLVEHILKNDKNVFEELLTTDKFYLYHDGNNERMQAESDRLKKIYNYFKDKDWKNFKKEDIVKHADFLREVKMRSVDPDKLDSRNRQGDTLKLFKLSMESITARLDKGQKDAPPFDLYRGYGYDIMPAYNVAKFYDISLDRWNWSPIQPAHLPNRKGILTHPSWLIANAKNTETDPIHRGKWVREKLLAGIVPEIPISVDAVIPEDHNRTLRDRLAGATETKYCWRCHEYMNPLGYIFEAYDDFGRFRVNESLEYPDQLIKKNPDKGTLLSDTRDIYKTLPVNSAGYLKGTGDEKLDGEIKDALDLAERLAKSTRVRQSFIRHTFRYFMGRNEYLSDSKTLIDAEQAYVNSNGSFDAVVVSLLTSDSFIYRKPIEN